MKHLLLAFSVIHGLMAILFAAAALLLIVIAAKVGWAGFAGALDRSGAQQIIEAVGVEVGAAPSTRYAIAGALALALLALLARFIVRERAVAIEEIELAIVLDLVGHAVGPEGAPREVRDSL